MIMDVVSKGEVSCYSAMDSFICENCGTRTSRIECMLSAAGEAQWICPQCLVRFAENS